MATVPVAFPFVDVSIDTSGLVPVAQRSPGVVAVVGASGSAASVANRPYTIDTTAQITQLFGEITPLSDALMLVMRQTPRPSGVYGVRVEGDDHAPGLAALEALDDVTFVALAGRTDQIELGKLKTHVEKASADGNKRMGVAMADPSIGKANDYVAQIKARVGPLRSDVGRMIVVAARGAQRQDAVWVKIVDARAAVNGEYDAIVMTGTVAGEPPAGLSDGPAVVVDAAAERATNVHSLVDGSFHRAIPTSRRTGGADDKPVFVIPVSPVADVAAAAMSAIAGYAPQVSTVLKPVRGFTMPPFQQFAPSEINGLSADGIIPVIDPSLIPGEGLYFAEGRTFSSDASLMYVDIMRVLDDIEFRLKAGLIGMIGDARITRGGLTRVKGRIEGIVGPLVRTGVIDGFTATIPVLDMLSMPESALTPTELVVIANARATRTVDLLLSVTYGPAVHRLKVTLAPKF